MESFHWDKNFETGIVEVDDQHRHLVDVINNFGNVLSNGEGASFGEVKAVLGELADYAHFHFSEEEMMMECKGIDPRHAIYQKSEHVSFLQQVEQMQAGLSPDNLESAKPLLRFLIYWLAHHILGTDQSMARQIVLIDAGTAPDVAYQTDESRRSDAEEPLLHALNGLFRQVSARNRELTELNQQLEAKVAERTQSLSDANRELQVLVEKLKAEQEESRRLSQELAAANQHLEALALTDALTGLPNRRHAMLCLDQVWAEAVKAEAPMACMMIDADGFKQINDTYGHDAGDVVLRELSGHLRRAVRTDDVVCRLGGDEFLIICPRTPLQGAMLVAEAMRQSVNALRVPAGGGEWKGSISVGVAARTNTMQKPEDLLKAADEAVYVSKRGGRNRVSAPPDATV